MSPKPRRLSTLSVTVERANEMSVTVGDVIATVSTVDSRVGPRDMFPAKRIVFLKRNLVAVYGEEADLGYSLATVRIPRITLLQYAVIHGLDVEEL